MSGSPVLRISHLSRNVSTPRWSGSGAIAGAEGIAVRTGRLTALTGPPGVGSSEILRTVFNAHIGGTGCLVYRARNGEAVQLSDLDDDSRRALRDREFAFAGRMCAVPANLSPLAYVVRDSVAGGTRLDDARPRAAALLERFGIEPRRHTRPAGELAPAEQHRINLARALAKRPRLLLLDEPSRELAADFQPVLAEELQRLKHSGTAMLIATRDQGLLDTQADEIITLQPRVKASA